MCGLVGFAGNNLKPLQKAFDFMLLVDQIRGFHSTGVATATRDGYKAMFKRAMNSTDFLDMKQPKAIINDFSYSAIIGHNRAATVGLVNTANAHPFNIGDITLAHNGTLRKQYLLDDSKDFAVDSENICHSVNKVGIEETVKKLCGAFALTYFNDKDKTLNMVRNSERPLHYAFTKNKESIVWASEPWMIEVACGKNNIQIDEIVALEVGQLMTVNLDVNNPKDITKEVTTKELELYKEVIYIDNTKKHSHGGRGMSGVPLYNQPYQYTLSTMRMENGQRIYTGEVIGHEQWVAKIRTSDIMEFNTVYSSNITGWSKLNGICSLQMGDYTKIGNKFKKKLTGTGKKSH